tara:strand:+ start:925 stop:1497 length:573 start_codon:yes stop_codon:yes gene_type:complete
MNIKREIDYRETEERVGYDTLALPRYSTKWQKENYWKNHEDEAMLWLKQVVDYIERVFPNMSIYTLFNLLSIVQLALLKKYGVELDEYGQKDLSEYRQYVIGLISNKGVWDNKNDAEEVTSLFMQQEWWELETLEEIIEEKEWAEKKKEEERKKEEVSLPEDPPELKVVKEPMTRTEYVKRQEKINQEQK